MNKGTNLHEIVHTSLNLISCVCSLEWNAGKVFKVVHGQGCALAEPRGPWHPTFALGQQENLFFFFKQITCWAT